TGEVLLGRRPIGKPYSGYWEFPGGKIEPGESARDALCRELKEELGIDPVSVYPWISRIFHYPHATVNLRFFRVTEWIGEPCGLEDQELSWQHPDSVSVSPLLPANAPILRALSLPSFHAITAASLFGVESQLERMKKALESGIRLIQVREPGMDREKFSTFAKMVIALCEGFDAKVLVNSDIAFAREIGASGIHLNSGMLMEQDSRPDFEWCGASVHNGRELEKASSLGLDYAVLGNVLETPTHPGRAGIGWENFARIVKDSQIPVYALGGLGKEHLPLAMEHGAHGIAMLRGAWD
ncbi:MAG: Nudix family hydrolase, partial [Burkholderiales bacterium]|nr:Nudix family hydrolase [Burkholderiales bacterium]